MPNWRIVCAAPILGTRDPPSLPFGRASDILAQLPTQEGLRIRMLSERAEQQCQMKQYDNVA